MADVHSNGELGWDSGANLDRGLNRSEARATDLDAVGAKWQTGKVKLPTSAGGEGARVLISLADYLNCRAEAASRRIGHEATKRSLIRLAECEAGKRGKDCGESSGEAKGHGPRLDAETNHCG